MHGDNEVKDSLQCRYERGKDEEEQVRRVNSHANYISNFV